MSLTAASTVLCISCWGLRSTEMSHTLSESYVLIFQDSLPTPTFKCQAGCPKTSVTNYQSTLRNILSYLLWHYSSRKARMLPHHCDSPRNILLTIRPPSSLVLIVKLRLDSTVIGCPFLERIADARRASSTMACPLSCMPPVTIRSCPMPSCSTPNTDLVTCYRAF